MVGPSITLCMFPDPPATGIGKYSAVPKEWVEEVWSWLLARSVGAQSLTVRTMVPFSVDVMAAKQLLDDARNGRLGDFAVVSAANARQTAVVQGYFAWGQLACSTVFTSSRLDDLVQAADQLKDLARHLASGAALAYLALEPHLGNQLTVFPYSSDDPMRGSLQSTAQLTDELLFDVFPWQILGPRHIGRLGTTPRGAVGLPNGRYELGFGELGDWLPQTPTRQALRSLAEGQLAACLPTSVDADALVRLRWGRQNSA